MSKVKLALLGCGDVAQRDYLPEFHRLAGRAQIVGVCAQTEERVRKVAQQYELPHWYTDYARMLQETEAEAIINLTPIQVHAETTLAALEAGKHVYSEKPVASSVAAAQRIQAAAQRHKRKLVCAPCVLLFPQVRYAQRLLNEDAIGAVYSARGHGHMGVPPWRGYLSDPAPFFAAGAGPAFDMGVYPLHTLTGLLGPVQRVTALVSRVLDDFVVPDGPVAGKRVPVEADDNWHMVLDFGNKRLATLAANNVVRATRAPQVEIHGLDGTITLNPIDVGAPVELFQPGSNGRPGWQSVSPPFPGADNMGRKAGPDHHLGIEHLVDCIEQDRTPLLSIEHAIHVVEIIEKAAAAAQTGVTQQLETTFSIS